jgi:predicted CopG family antitoxin
MATKTISLEISAYERLASARRSPKESFSQVIQRAEWPREGATGEKLLEFMRGGPLISDVVRRELEQAQSEDRPPVDRWG